MGTYRNIILIQNGEIEEYWSNLKLLCDNHSEFSYEYIKSKKFPFEYKGWEFQKFEVNKVSEENEQ